VCNFPLPSLHLVHLLISGLGRYGGIVVSQSVSAGQSTVSPSDPPFHLYSAQGTFLGSAAINVPTTFTVLQLRTTKTFPSRQVIASQQITDPKTKGIEARNILIALLDCTFKNLIHCWNTLNRPCFPYHPIPDLKSFDPT